MIRISSMVSFTALCLLGVADISAAQTTNLNLLQIPRFAPDKVLIKFKPGTAASDIGDAHRQTQGQILKTIPGISVQVVTVPAGTVLDKVAVYKANPNVEYAEPDFYRILVIPTEDPDVTPAGGTVFQEQWYLDNTGQLHNGSNGGLTEGTANAHISALAGWDFNQGLRTTDPASYNTPKIAVLDSGADCNTLELQFKCLEQVNLVGLNPGGGYDGCTSSEPACDNLGHGTFTASEAAAETDDMEGIAGAGWNTSIGVYKVCYQELVTDGVNFFFVGLCPVSGSADAITRAATDTNQPDEWGNPARTQYHVITMSYGSDIIDNQGNITPSTSSNAECSAVQYARNQGVVVVAAAGNNGNTTKVYPAACTDDINGQSTVISVAATDHHDGLASFSTYSKEVDDWVSLAAPGDDIIGVQPDSFCGLDPGVDTCVTWWDGTSMAAPLVAGTAALVWTELYKSGVDGGLAPAVCTVSGIPCNQMVRQYLEDNADKIGAANQTFTRWTQHGRLNMAAALAAAAAGGAAPTNTPPAASFTFGCTDLNCSFDGSGSSDSDGTISTYAWNLGDNTSDTGATVNHTYGVGGTYTVALTVTDDGGAVDSILQNVTVSEPAGGGGTGDPNKMGVYAISWKGGRHLDVTVNIRRDSDSSGTLTDSDEPVGSASVDMQVCLIGGQCWNVNGSATDGSGNTTWKLLHASSGTYQATVTNVTHSTYTYYDLGELENIDKDNPDSYTK